MMAGLRADLAMGENSLREPPPFPLNTENLTIISSQYIHNVCSSVPI